MANMLSQDVFVGDVVLPADAQDSSEALYVEGVNLAFLRRVQGPGLAAVKERIENASLVDSHLGVCGQHGNVPGALCKASYC